MPVRGKRPAQAVVDLTHDGQENAHRPAKIGRTSQTNSSAPLANVTNGQRFGQDIDYISLSQMDDDDFNSIVPATQAGDDLDLNSFQLYGCINTKIVGVRFYSGYASSGERVTLQREPDNKYDRNAIKVLNVMGAQIGHIPRNVASDLAKYLDSKSLVIEGMLTGSIGSYDCPIALTLYGPSDLIRKDQVRTQMRADRLPLTELIRIEQDSARKEWQRQKALMEVDKQRLLGNKRGSGGYPTLQRPKQAMESTSLEDLVQQSSSINAHRVDQAVERFGNTEVDLANMPMAETPFGMKTQLLSYQRQGLAWMLEKESPKLPEVGAKDVQLWKKEHGRYKNIATNYATSTPPPLASGGILADDMGLGKTIQTISLIMANSNADGNGITAPTLIVSPVGVMSNWKQQIEMHVKPEFVPKILVYHGTGKKEGSKLKDYGVVITSYGAIASEYDADKKKAKSTRSGLYSLKWRRIVLDEGHTLRNPRSKGALAACHLEADSRWSLTGTPIINTLKDLYSQIRFLRLSGGLEDLAIFNAVLIRPLTNGETIGATILQALMGAICLRRRKDMAFVNLRLPDMKMHVLRVKFEDHELKKYEMFQNEARGMLDKYKHQVAGPNGATTYSHVLEVLLRLRQVCNHWSLCKNRVDKLMALLGESEKKVVELTPENIKALQDILQLQIESQETCAICLDDLSEPVITACAHAFDKSCIEQVIERQHKCPLCRAELKDTGTLVAPATEMGEDAGADDAEAADASAPSSKIKALIKILTAKGQAEQTKTVVFSQWTSFLDIIEPHLTANDVRFTRIDGKLNSNKRDQAIAEFSNDPKCKVLLASLNVCSVGLNLVAANQVILCDSWWAPAIEDQAIDRVYRLGQTRETMVWRLVMEGSVEDNVLKIQAAKRELSSTALSERTDKKKGESTQSRLADLEKLLRRADEPSTQEVSN
ncbi:hypothetical protein EYB25_004416 [Talaromyces marneffei]|uniref:uncharacterized protein n=1 Tax=Talaromyces marneffei TaxID=37727 RepID=UPI0012A9685F|nr:uncharacterized protein EYB26_004502 [Talaromyces marneffei]KAE8553037.1 hypothetical protein EYB25_004416 [Talaromyces marneffei]QGA16832.1 hypothetical protein EYB26_004502 [Talaromyces marneffei]